MGSLARAAFAATGVGIAVCGIASRAEASDAACAQARVYRSEKMLVAARETLCGTRLCDVAKHTECADLVLLVDEETPTVTFSVKGRNGAPMTDFHVTVDGKPFRQSAEVEPAPLDPGAHSLLFEAPGVMPVARALVLASGQREALVSVTLDEPIPVGGSSGESVLAKARDPRWMSAGYLAIGLGALAVGTGAFFAVQRAEANCNGTSCGSHVREQRFDVSVMDMGFVVGGLLIAAGTGILVLAPSTRPETALRLAPLVSSSSGVLSLAGAW